MKSVLKYILLSIIVLSLHSCNKKTEVTHYPNGEIKEQYQTRNGQNVGEYVYYYENGVLGTKGKFRKGKMNGEWYYYYPDGKIMTIQTIRKGKTIRFDTWDQSGQKVIDNGTGTITLYYPNGSKKSTITYKNGHFDGTIQSWYFNGTMESEQSFDEGKPIGTWRSWDEEGSLINEEVYE